MIRNPAILLTILLVAISTSGQRQAPPSATPLALTNANIVNVRDGHVTSNATLVLRSGRIETVGQSVPPAGTTVIDLKGKYVLPGLIDAHVHAFASDVSMARIEASGDAYRTAHAARMPSGYWRHSRTLPVTSVSRKVTVPVGGASTICGQAT